MNQHSFQDDFYDPFPPDWPMELEVDALQNATEIATHSSEASLPQAEALSMSSVWQMKSLAAADAALNSTATSYAYRRIQHPNAISLATKLGQLHGTQHAVVSAQGMSSMAAIALAKLQPGARVWLSEELYGETTQMFANSLRRWQVTTEVFDPTHSEHLQKLAANHVDMVIIETMTNPRLHVPDIAKVAQAAKASGALLVVDNTFATHLLCRPLQLGADFVIESLGKQVNGHSDGMVGFVAGQNAHSMEGILGVIKTFGLTSSPLDCYLTHRGLLSLGVRMERVCENALALARFLSGHPKIRQVDYPGLPEHSEHRVALQQFTGGFGWMVTFHVERNRVEVEGLLSDLRPEIRFLPSLGDVSTTVSHPLSTSHRGFSAETLAKLGITQGTIRVSCGLEPTEWLIDCFRKALA